MANLLTRRDALRFAAASAVGCATGCVSSATASRSVASGSVFACDRRHATVCHPLIREPLKFTVIADSHFAFIDARDADHAAHAKRMAQWPTKEGKLDAALAEAKRFGAGFVAMIGDMISFPSHANVEFLARKMKASGLDCRYIAGNHDWHFEGVPGTDDAQRAEWIAARLLPLYGGENPMGYAFTKHGVRLVFLDDSSYTISDEQLAFVKAELARGMPTCFFMHIPFWTPARPAVGVLANPDWGAKTDKHWKTEGRLRWPESGQGAACFALKDVVFSAPNTVAVFAGHEHFEQTAVFGGVPQFTVSANSYGDYLDVSLLPSGG